MLAVAIGMVLGIVAGVARMHVVNKDKKDIQAIMEAHVDSPFEAYRHSLFMVYYSDMMLIPGGYGMYL
ncbi:MAG: hypothetical protein IKL88_04350, partial [Erysipelotrichales bacterium]|nr:hypothetical protein [Erysipelotrichales bacterium]